MQRRCIQEKLTLSLHDQAIELIFPHSIAHEIRRLFQWHDNIATPPQSTLAIVEDDKGYALSVDDVEIAKVIAREKLLLVVLEEVTRALITRLSSAVALHAAAISCGETPVLMPGVSGSGKTSLAAWLLDNGFAYLTDEIAVLSKDGILGLPRAFVFKPRATEAILGFDKAELIECGSNLLGIIPSAATSLVPRRAGLIIFPHFEQGAPIKIKSLAAGEAGLRLIACNLNARNLSDGGLASIASLARETPAVALRYGKFEQLKGILDELIRLVVENNLSVSETRRLLLALSATEHDQAPAISQKRYPVPDATPKSKPKSASLSA